MTGHRTVGIGYVREEASIPFYRANDWVDVVRFSARNLLFRKYQESTKSKELFSERSSRNLACPLRCTLSLDRAQHLALVSLYLARFRSGRLAPLALAPAQKPNPGPPRPVESILHTSQNPSTSSGSRYWDQLEINRRRLPILERAQRQVPPRQKCAARYPRSC
jgi:hypothetical protein